MAAVQQTRQEQQQHQEQQQEQQDQLELQSLLLLPNDVWERVLTITDPKDICSLGCSSMHNSHLAGSKRRGVLLARHCGRLQLRVVRQCMRARSTFVSNTCSRQQLDSREASQAQILATLQRSPDPVPDLAAALQQGLTLISSQTSLVNTLAAPIRADLVRCANFVCLLAWRQHMRKRRGQPATQQAAPVVVAAAAAAAAEAVGVVHQPTVAGPQQEHAQLVAAAPQQQQQQQEQGAADAEQPQQQAAAVQTEIGPSLVELDELLTGLTAIMAAPGNPSLRLLRPSLNLLHHLLLQQLQGWNLPQPQADQQQLQAWQQAAGAVVPGAEGAAAAQGVQVENGDAGAVAAAVIGGSMEGVVDAQQPEVGDGVEAEAQDA